MYWLGFFVTFVIIAVALLVYNKRSAEPVDVVEELTGVVLAVVSVVILSAMWPLVWTVAILCVVTYIVYKFVLRIFDAKTKKDKSDV